MSNVRVVCTAGSLAGNSFDLIGGPVFIFGRYAKAHVVLVGDPSASQLHFLIDISNDKVRVTDLGSTNGLVVNDILYGGKFGKMPVEFIPLASGDVIAAGNNQFRVEIADEPHKLGAKPVSTTRRESAGGNENNTIQRRRDDSFARPKPSSRKTDSEPIDFPAVEGYTIIDRIGIGGRGVVYKAIQDQTGERVAIKIMLARTTKKRRALDIFRREIQITKQLSHPNIIRYLGDGLAGGAPYLALEYVNGGNLDQRLSDMPDKRMPFVQAIPLFIQILEATSYMHQKGLVHKDIKPKNILLDLRRGGGMAAKLSDMGLSSRTATADDEFMPAMNEGGTPAYMPPEQLTDITKALPQSDVFSAAATAYQMLSGRLLYDFKDKDQVTTILDGNIVPILTLCPDLPGRFAEVINKALSYYPESRYADAEEMLVALRSALQ